MRRRWYPWIALAGCAAPEPNPVADPTPPPAAEDWQLSGTVTDYLGDPVPGIEVAARGELVTTDADGGFAFTIPEAGPVQVDAREASGDVIGTLSCGAPVQLWTWTGGRDARGGGVSLTVLGDGLDPATTVVLQSTRSQGWTSTSDLGLGEPVADGLRFELDDPGDGDWTILVSALGLAPSFGRLDGEGPPEGPLSLTLEPPEAWQAWDGQVPAGPEVLRIDQRLEVAGAGLWWPVALWTGGVPPAPLPVPQVQFDVREYEAWARYGPDVGCASSDVRWPAPPVGPEGVLTLPAPPDRPSLQREPGGGLSWTIPDGFQGASLAAFSWDADGTLLPSWYVQIPWRCGDRLQWPEQFLDRDEVAAEYARIGARSDARSVGCEAVGP